jgi:hypothetical protein
MTYGVYFKPAPSWTNPPTPYIDTYFEEFREVFKQVEIKKTATGGMVISCVFENPMQPRFDRLFASCGTWGLYGDIGLDSKGERHACAGAAKFLCQFTVEMPAALNRHGSTGMFPSQEGTDGGAYAVGLYGIPVARSRTIKDGKDVWNVDLVQCEWLGPKRFDLLGN